VLFAHVSNCGGGQNTAISPRVLICGDGRCGLANEYSWYESYKAAVLETDWTKIQGRILRAEHEIHERQIVLAKEQGGTPEERQALEDAVNGLRGLMNDASVWQSRQSNVPPSTRPSV